MNTPADKFVDITKREPAWSRYSFAVTICALAVLLGLLLDRVTSDRLYPFFPAIAAIVASAAWSGAGAGMMATFLMIGWSAFDLLRHGLTPQNDLLRCIMLLVVGVLLSVGSSRMWRSMRHAARSEAWHRQLVETTGEGIWVHDERGVITYANARMSEMLGIAGDGLIGRYVEEFFLPADRSMERIRAANLQDRQKEQFDRRLRRHDGSEIWVLTCCNLIVDGENPGALAMMTDITERKRAEYALRRSEERFRNLFEAVLEGVYQSTPDGRITEANPMFLQMLGLSNDAELNGFDMARDLCVDPRLRQRLREQLERDGGYQNVEFEVRRPDGRIISVLENAHAVRDEQGAILYCEATLTDITPQKRIQEQLRQAQQVEILGQLAGSVAEDFGNILTMVTGFSQLALSELPPAHPARSSLEQALEASGAAVGITRQLLSFSRRQSQPEAIADLNQALERSEAARQPDVSVSLSGEHLPVYASQKQLESIFWTLCARIREENPERRLDITTALVHLREENWRDSAPPAAQAGYAAGQFAVLTIGSLPGSPLDSLQDGVASSLCPMQAGQSAAMGLSSAYAAIAQCGGFLVACDSGTPDSRRIPGFQVFLPCAVRTEEHRRTEPATGETILLVEDDPLIRELSRDMLERQGYGVILASSAKEAEELSGISGSFDLLITASLLPNITGPELARRLRASRPGLKVLFISGYADEPPENSLEGPFLQKPFSADSLGRKIRQMLNRA